MGNRTMAFKGLTGLVKDTQEDNVQPRLFPVAGSLTQFLVVWKLITTDSWIL